MKFFKFPNNANPVGPKKIATILEVIIPDNAFTKTIMALYDEAFTTEMLELKNLNFIKVNLLQIIGDFNLFCFVKRVNLIFSFLFKEING